MKKAKLLLSNVEILVWSPTYRSVVKVTTRAVDELTCHRRPTPNMGFCSAIQVREIKIIPEKDDAETEAKILAAVLDGNVSELEQLHVSGRLFLRFQDELGWGLLHHAASKNRSSVIEFLLTCGIDVNTVDHNGNTPLHVAVENDALESIEYLIFRGSDSSIRNKQRQAPIHVAADKNCVKAMQLLVLHKDKVDLLLGGENGKTALHLAANKDFTEIVSAILQSKLRVCLTKTCEHGVPAVIEAARNGAHKTLELMLQAGKEMGYDPADMLKLVDMEGNTALHSAVHAGDVEHGDKKTGNITDKAKILQTVKICLQHGAKITTLDHNMATPVHLACSQGTFEILRLMFTWQPDDKVKTLNTRDSQGMTPLHFASMFNHQELVKFLIEQGADIDLQDNDGRTPLLLAASRSGWPVVQLLLSLGANIRIRDRKNQNILHFIITHGGSLEDFAGELGKIDKAELNQLLNEKDMHGCTPLHFATRGGRIRSTESLIKLGACVNTKNNDNESPLHFATRYGRYNTVVELLTGDKGSYIINETDGEGLSPLHIAAQNGHTRIVQLLLNKGALLEKDHKGRTALHLSTESGYVKTMVALLAVHSNLIDQVDKAGNTPLHIAASKNQANAITLLLDMKCQILKNGIDQSPMDIALQLKHHEAAMAMATHVERAPETLEMNSVRCELVIKSLITNMPEVFMAVLDKCIIYSEKKEDSENYYILYDFKYLQYTRKIFQTMKDDNKKYNFLPLPAMNNMVESRRLELLCHPVCQKYIQMKWNGYGMYFHMANLVIYIIFMVFLTSFAATLISEMNMNNHNDRVGEKQNTSTGNHDLSSYRSRIYYGGMRGGMASDAYPKTEAKRLDIEFESTSGLYWNGLVISAFIFFNIVKEIGQLFHQRLKYLIDPINLLEWLLYLSAAVMISPVFLGNLDSTQLQCAAVAAFVSWFNFLLYLQRFDRVGIYVVMFLEILKTLVKALVIFSILFIAFGLAFYILLSHDHLIFSSLPISFIRVFSMMLGEFDILGTFVMPIFRTSTSQRSFFPHFTLGFLVIFMVLMPILLVNLLIGLAVGDIEGVRRNAQLKRIAMQVELHTELEKKLPQFILHKADKQEVLEYPNAVGKSRYKWLWPVIQKIFGGSYAGRQHGPMSGHAESQEDYMYEELYKHKQRLKEMSTTLEQLHLLVRLIVRKMEIKTEADDCDENVSKALMTGKNNKWASPALRTKLRTINALLPSSSK